jgi:Polysaccharide pyruvyl transferase
MIARSPLLYQVARPNRYASDVRRIKTYYWVGRKNFGDLLGPLLLKHFASVHATWAPVEEASLIGPGSIIEHLPDGWEGQIVGSGKLHEESKLPVGRIEYLGLRGPLTAKDVRGDFAIGDPGLLANELVEVETKEHLLGLVPHWSDKALAERPEFRPYKPVVIDVTADPLEVIRTIGGCYKIVTSSLHGMILADAFAIPRRFEWADRLRHEGGTFKFSDYLASIGETLKIGVTTTANRQRVDDRKSEVFDALRALEDLRP